MCALLFVRAVGLGPAAGVLAIAVNYAGMLGKVRGFVGAGGLGQMLYVALSVFKTNEAATLLIAMIVIVVAVDLCGWLRRFLGASSA